MVSTAGSSNGVVLDKTPPIPGYLIHHSESILQNPSFETTSENIRIDFNYLNRTDLCRNNENKPTNWTISEYSCIVIISSDRELSKHGKRFAYLRGNISQELRDVELGLYRVTFSISHLHFDTSVSSNREAFVQFDSEDHVVLLHSKWYRQDNYAIFNERKKFLGTNIHFISSLREHHLT